MKRAHANIGARVSVILGINGYHAGAAAALVVDGEPVVAIAEERLNRVKHHAGFPARAIRCCLDHAGLSFSDVDTVALGRDRSANRTRKLAYVARNPGKLLNLTRLRTARAALDDVRDSLPATAARIPARCVSSSTTSSTTWRIPPAPTLSRRGSTPRG